MPIGNSNVCLSVNCCSALQEYNILKLLNNTWEHKYTDFLKTFLRYKVLQELWDLILAFHVHTSQL